MIKTVLFDLDGTLLPMNQDVFVKDYFSRLCEYLSPVGFEGEKLVRSIWQSLRKMSEDSSDKTNEQIICVKVLLKGLLIVSAFGVYGLR